MIFRLRGGSEGTIGPWNLEAGCIKTVLVLHGFPKVCFWRVFRGFGFSRHAEEFTNFSGFFKVADFCLYQKRLHFLVTLTKRPLKCQVTYPQSQSFECLIHTWSW